MEDEQKHVQDRLLDHVLPQQELNQQINDHHTTKTPTEKIYTTRDLHRLRWSTSAKLRQKHQLQSELFLLADEVDALQTELTQAEMQHKPITLCELQIRGRKVNLNNLKINEAQAKQIMDMLARSGMLDNLTSLQQVD